MSDSEAQTIFDEQAFIGPVAERDTAVLESALISPPVSRALWRMYRAFGAREVFRNTALRAADLFIESELLIRRLTHNAAPAGFTVVPTIVKAEPVTIQSEECVCREWAWTAAMGMNVDNVAHRGEGAHHPACSRYSPGGSDK